MVGLTRLTVRVGSPLRSSLALYSMQRHLSTVEVRQQPPPVPPSAPSAEPSRVPPLIRRPSVALGYLWLKSLTLPTSSGQMDIVKKMIIGNQLRLRVISCLLYPLPLISL